MYQVKKGNVERIVDSKEKCDNYLAKGFTLLGQVGQTTPDAEGKQLSGMTVEELTAYATEKGIDIGKASSAEGVLKKITEALQEVVGGDDHGDDKGRKAENPAGDNNQ